MPSETIMSGWNTTDEEPVHIRSAETVHEETVHIGETPAHNVHALPIQPVHEAARDALRMRMAAIAGVAIVLICTAFYFGVLNLQGDVTGGQGGTPQTVTITKSGAFEPASIDVRPGDSVTLKNENADPQVLKSKDGRDLFPVQVLFDTPFSFTVPSNAEGKYIYMSETLPNETTLTFNVSATSSATSSSAASSTTSTADTPATTGDNGLDIPLPFGSGPITSISSSAPSGSVTNSSTSSSAFVPQPVAQTPTPSSTTPATVQQSNDSATIALTGDTSVTDTGTPSMMNSALPTNPYTVGTQDAYSFPTESVPTTTTPTVDQNLHGGAPLLELQNHAPKKVTETGPEGALLLLIPAFLGLAIVFRRSLRSA